MIFCVFAWFLLGSAEARRYEFLAGIETRIEDVPFIVSIQSKIMKANCNGSSTKCESWRHICTGIIISERHVMTVAPCFFRKAAGSEKLIERDPNNVLVLAGSDAKDRGRRMAVSHFCYHKYYSTNSSLDSYAVIFLNDKFKFGNKVKVAKVPKGRSKDSTKEIQSMVAERKLGYVYGWDMKDDLENTQLIMIQVRLSGVQKCRDALKTSDINESQQFCGTPTGMGLGDIGSPLVIDKVVWGIYVTSEDGNQAPTIFSRIDTALNWKKLVTMASAQPTIVFQSFLNFLDCRIVLIFSLTLHTINII